MPQNRQRVAKDAAAVAARPGIRRGTSQGAPHTGKPQHESEKNRAKPLATRGKIPTVTLYCRLEGSIMANFCSYPEGERISEVAIPNSMDKGAASVTIGLWGYLNQIGTGTGQGSELEVMAQPFVSVKKGDIKV